MLIFLFVLFKLIVVQYESVFYLYHCCVNVSVCNEIER